MESVLACLFGCEVNLLQGEGNELTEAAVGAISCIDIRIAIWLETLFCEY